MRAVCRKFFLGCFIVVFPHLLFADKGLLPYGPARAATAVGKIENGDFAGSGFFLKDGKTFVTAFHVIERLLDEAPFHSLIISQGIEPAGAIRAQRIIRLSSLYDLALLEVSGYEGSPLKLSHAPPATEEAYIMGFPAKGGFYALKGRVTAGQPRQPMELIVDAALSALRDEGPPFRKLVGFSGSPVLNDEGQVIGVVSYGFSNMAFAVRSAFLKDLLRLGPLQKRDSVSPERQVEREAQNLERRARSGCVLAQYLLALRLNRTDRQSAVRWLEQAAEKGFAPAQSDLGLTLLEESGAPQDKRKAAYWFERAAEQGFPPAQFHFGSLLKGNAGGEGNSPDLAKALYWYGTAAERGFAPAQFQVGWMLREGLGAPQDKEKAAYWYGKAAERGFTPAQVHLAEMLRKGEGIPQNIERSIHWIRKSRQ